MNRQPDAAKVLATQIGKAAAKVSGKLEEKTWNARKTGVTSDDMSKAMMPFLDEVEQIIRLPNSTEVAFDLVLDLAGYSYGEMDCKGCGYGERPSDIEIDDLLVELAPERRKIDPFWNFVEVLETLADQAKYLNGYGIEDFCSQTIKLLSEWKECLPTDAKLNGAEEERTLPSCQEMLKPLT